MSEEIALASADLATVARLQAENAALMQALAAVKPFVMDRGIISSRAAWKQLVATLDAEHPGAALLTELEAARAVVTVVRWAVENHYAPPPLCDALAVYDQTRKARGE